jgi:hypothetical protein
LSGPRPATFQHYKPERRKIAKENRKKIGKQLPRSRLSNIVKRREKKRKTGWGAMSTRDLKRDLRTASKS